MEFSKKEKPDLNPNETQLQTGPSRVGVRTLKSPEGSELVNVLSSLSGLSGGTVESEIQHILGVSEGSDSKPTESLTLEELRSAMLSYLEVINQEMTQLEQAQALDAAEPPTPLFS